MRNLEGHLSLILWELQAVKAALLRVEEKFDGLQKGQQKMSVELDRLSEEVKEAKDVQTGASKLLGELSTLIRNNASDPVAMNKLADDLDASNQALAAAVLANTPGGPPAPPAAGARGPKQSKP